ncbi:MULTISPECIES: 2-amino-4-hydroxy-6-hydroxymethyldihydropteridine diphosphokinase [unclassified Marinovum]
MPERGKKPISCNLNGKVALIAIGANLPFSDNPPVQTLREAIFRLSERGLAIGTVSPVYTTPCFPAGAGPDYVNGAFSANWSRGAPALLSLLHEVESEFLRTRNVRWGMRTLDLDLLALGDQVLPNPDVWAAWRNLPLADQMTRTPDELILPHPRLQDRPFVLVPLRDVAPDWVHPVTGRSVSEMAAALPQADMAEVKAL